MISIIKRWKIIEIDQKKSMKIRRRSWTGTSEKISGVSDLESTLYCPAPGPESRKVCNRWPVRTSQVDSGRSGVQIQRISN